MITCSQVCDRHRQYSANVYNLLDTQKYEKKNTHIQMPKISVAYSANSVKKFEKEHYYNYYLLLVFYIILS